MKIILTLTDYALTKLLRLILEDEGYEVFSFSDVNSLVEWLGTGNKKPDILFVDFSSPRTGAVNLIDLLHSPEFSSICTILVSIYPPENQFGQQQWDYYLKQPFSIKQLFEIINKCIGKE
jgi:DNA-binding response OmpR family regulator